MVIDASHKMRVEAGSRPDYCICEIDQFIFFSAPPSGAMILIYGSCCGTGGWLALVVSNNIRHLLSKMIIRKCLLLLSGASYLSIKKTGWSFRRGFVLLAANRLKEMLPSMTSTSDLHIAVPTVVWACARLGVQHDLLLAVAQHLGSKTKVSKLPDWGLCVLAWSFQVLELELMDFEELLLTEINKRGFTDEKVERSQLGSWEWQEESEEPEELEASE